MLYQDMNELDKHNFDMDVEFIHNVYKDVHGVRPRDDFYSMSDLELRGLVIITLTHCSQW